MFLAGRRVRPPPRSTADGKQTTRASLGAAGCRRGAGVSGAAHEQPRHPLGASLHSTRCCGPWEHSATPCRVCPVGFVVSDSATACTLQDPCADPSLNDCHPQATCTTVSDGHYACECVEGFWGGGVWCAPWTECLVGSTYETRRPTSQADRVCTAVSVCGPGEFETTAPDCLREDIPAGSASDSRRLPAS